MTQEKAPWEYTPMRHCNPIPIPEREQRYHKLCKMCEIAWDIKSYDIAYHIEIEMKKERKKVYK